MTRKQTCMMLAAGLISAAVISGCDKQQNEPKAEVKPASSRPSYALATQPEEEKVAQTQASVLPDGPPAAPGTVVSKSGKMSFKQALDAAAAAPGEEVTTLTGLKYKDINVGTGAEVSKGKRVYVHYTGWLKDGFEFDSSYKRGVPFDFFLGRGSVIAGWDEGVASMKIGGRRVLTIPAHLGYGSAGTQGIPGGATLIFDVELVDAK